MDIGCLLRSCIAINEVHGFVGTYRIWFLLCPLWAEIFSLIVHSVTDIDELKEYEEDEEPKTCESEASSCMYLIRHVSWSDSYVAIYQRRQCVTSNDYEFFTGAEVPPMGYKRPPELNFNPTSPYPTSYTCALQLTLPTCYSEYGPFKSALNTAFTMHGGFELSWHCNFFLVMGLLTFVALSQCNCIVLYEVSQVIMLACLHIEVEWQEKPGGYTPPSHTIIITTLGSLWVCILCTVCVCACMACICVHIIGRCL